MGDLRDIAARQAAPCSISTESYREKKEMNTNTILVSINGTLGNLAFYDGEKIILGKSACYFNLLNDINKYFIGFLIKSQYFLKYAVDVASETTIKNVSLKSMRYLPIPLPPLAEQERIVAKLEKLMKFCDELEVSIKLRHHQRRPITANRAQRSVRAEIIFIALKQFFA